MTAATPAPPADRCDLLIAGATVVDGSGAPGFTADVAIDGDRITAIGDLRGWQGEERIDAAGRVLAPGFIDVHTHDDQAVFEDRAMTCKISQGVTTVIAGNCGISLAPCVPAEPLPAPFPLLGPDDRYRFPSVRAYRKQFEKTPPAVNLALLAGHSSLRASCMRGTLERAASDTEIRLMQEQLDAALGEGCIGLSTGLDYPPAKQSTTDELVSLARVVGSLPGRVFTSHIRDEADGVIEAVEEVLDIGARGEVPIVISHHKCAGKRNHGRSRETLAVINARKASQPVALDVYPYIASSTSLLPQYVREAERVLVTYSDPHPKYAGWDLDDVARDLGCTPVEAADTLYPGGAVYFQMCEDDVARIMADPDCMIGSDGLPGGTKPHPRLWGTFPRVLSKYVRDDGVLTLEQAVHKMTGLGARKFGLQDRGFVREGYFADLVLFDPATVRDEATFSDPERPSTGIHSVLVNGTQAWTGTHNEYARTGRFLASQ